MHLKAICIIKVELNFHHDTFLVCSSALKYSFVMASKGYAVAKVTMAVVLLLAYLHIAETGAEAEFKLGKENISQLHFYFHDLLVGKNVTAVQVASGGPRLPLPALTLLTSAHNTQEMHEKVKKIL